MKWISQPVVESELQLEIPTVFEELIAAAKVRGLVKGHLGERASMESL